MLDAYTVKKAIPRVVIAVIAINLSIYLCIAAIDITTILGRGLHSLLVTPFIEPDSFSKIEINDNVENAGVAGVLGMGALGGIMAIIFSKGAALVWLLGLFGPMILTVVLIALAVLFTLIIRQGLLVFLTIISPVAIACYILPGTEKYFKQWWDLFLKTLLVYPIIAAIFAMCNVLAAILLNTASGGGSMFPGNYFAQQSDAMGTLQIVTAIIVLYLPLVLIPFAFKLAGGAIAAVMNVANSRASSLAGRGGQAIQKSRQDSTSWLGKNAIRAKDNRIRSGFTGGQILSGVGAAARLRNPRTAMRSRGDILSRVRARDAMQNNAQLQQLAFDDNGIALMALSGGSRAGAQRAADRLQRDRGWTDDQKARALASAQSVGFNSSNTMGAIELMAQNKSRALSGTLAGREGLNMVRQSAMEASGGNVQAMENIMGGFAYHSRNSGRLDFGGEKDGSTGGWDTNLRDGWNRAGVGQHMQSYGASLQAHANHFRDVLNDPASSDSDRRAAAIAFAEMHGNMSQATGENQNIINEVLQGDLGIDYESGVSVEEQLSDLAGGATSVDEIRNSARTWGSADAARAGGTGTGTGAGAGGTGTGTGAGGTGTGGP